MLAKTIAGIRVIEDQSGKFSATQPENIAPKINWPSAPIFHTFARKQNTSPVAVMIRGTSLYK